MKDTLHLVFFSLLLFIASATQGQIITTIAGSGGTGYTGDGGAATAATFAIPSGIALDTKGNVFIADNGFIPFSPVILSVVRRIDTAGIITTIAGKADTGFGGDTGPATAAFMFFDWGVAVDGNSNIYVSDENNNRIRKIDPAGIIYTIAGIGSPADNGDNGPAISAAIGNPVGITVDGAGNIYFGDVTNHVIRKISAAGTITTVAGVAGSSGFSGDAGPATLATFSDIYSLYADNIGNLYICDAGNNRIRRVNSAGTITTIAGNGSPGYNGDLIAATAASLYHPTGVCTDGVGNIYIADCYNNRIRKINAAGIISTTAGTGTAGFSGDNGLATAAEINNPVCLAVDKYDNIFFTDLGNERVREIYKDLTFVYGHNTELHVCQNVSAPISAPLDSILQIRDLTVGELDTWTLLNSPTQGTVNTLPYTATSAGNFLTPSGVFYTPRLGYSGADSFTVMISNLYDTNTIKVYVSVDTILSFAGTISGLSYVCMGHTTQLIDSAGGGVWGASNSNASISNGTVTGNIAGIDTITYSITNTCGSVTISKAINIYPLPDAGTVTGPSAICIGSVVNFEDNISGGIWSLGFQHITALISGADSATTSGTDTVFYTVNDGFCSNTAFLQVEVDSTPFVRTGPWDTTICVGSAYVITDTPAGGNWSVANGNVSIAHDTVTGLSQGIDTVKYTISNACGSVTSNNVVNVNQIPDVPVINQIGSILYAPAGYTAYQWFFNGSPILGSTADTFLVANTGQYSVYVRNQSGCIVISDPVKSDGCTAADIAVYPNPTESIVYIKWCKAMTIKVLCDDGKTLETISDADHIDISSFPDADYLFVIYDVSGHKLKTQKVTKLRR